MFRLIEASNLRQVEIDLDGNRVTVPEGISVAAAMLYSGYSSIRDSFISNSPRAPFCMIGQCFDCLVTIDGRPNLRACQIVVKKGMCVVLQRKSAASP